jgi:hypothetical protein
MSMQMPDHLIQIIAKADELAVNELACVMDSASFRSELASFIEKEGAAEMNGAHADRFRTQSNLFKLARSEAKIELLVARF